MELNLHYPVRIYGREQPYEVVLYQEPVFVIKKGKAIPVPGHGGP
jgi:hypothetical protein